MNLKACLDKYKCDKGYKHHYHLEYEKELEKVRDEPVNFLEIGVWHGASTAAFHDYMPNATFWCVDTFERVNASKIEVLNRDRVKWLKADSTTDTFNQEMKDWIGNIEFDFVIDDGKHTHTANKQTFDSLIEFVKDGGIYWIEDVFALDKMSEKWVNDYWTKKKIKRGTVGLVPMAALKGSLMQYKMEEINHLDLSGEPDSYIYKVTK